MRVYKDHLIASGSSIKKALEQLNILGKDAVLFVVNANDELIGSLTDGDIRRGLLEGISIDTSINEIIQSNPKFIKKGERDVEKIIAYREANFKILPVVDDNGKVVNVINFRFLRSYLPVDAVVMAGGKGARLHPLTEKIPKPLLKVGNKAIMEHNVDRLALFGIDDFWFSVNHLGEQVNSYFGNGQSKNLDIKYTWENKPLGTIGAITRIDDFKHSHVLVTNSDILTNLDYEQFYLDFLNEEADLSVVSVPYKVNIPYAVFETEKRNIKSLKEKPLYTYYSNGGIYLIKRDLINCIPKETFFDATDMIELFIKNKKKVVTFPISCYWLDIGKPEDFIKAQIDIKQVKF
jgi:dTDP-glucose pyrophosphorylase